MAPDSITIRFPSGAWEYGFMDKTPEVGDTIVRQGVTWVVTDVTPLVDDHRNVTMALAPDLMDHDKPDVSTGKQALSRPMPSYSASPARGPSTA